MSIKAHIVSGVVFRLQSNTDYKSVQSALAAFLLLNSPSRRRMTLLLFDALWLETKLASYYRGESFLI